MNDFFGNDDANAERNLVCEFEGCGKRYSTEHSRRQHYRRHHKDEWEQLQNVRKAEKRLSLTPSGVSDGTDSDNHASQSSSQISSFLNAKRPPPLSGVMTEPSSFMNLLPEPFGVLGAAPLSPSEARFPARSPLVNRARSPYALPAQHSAPSYKRHSLGNIFPSALSPTLLSPHLSPTMGSSQAPSLALQQQMLDTQRRAQSPQPQPAASMFDNNPFSRSRSFNDLLTQAALMNELSTDFVRSRSMAASGAQDPAFSSLTAMAMGSAPLNPAPVSPSYDMAQTHILDAFDSVLLESMLPPPMSPASSYGNLNSLPRSPVTQAPPLSPASSFAGLSMTGAAPPLSPVASLPAMGILPDAGHPRSPRLMSQFSTPTHQYQPPANYEPRRTPSLTVSGIDGTRPITSISQEIAALLAEPNHSNQYTSNQFNM